MTFWERIDKVLSEKKISVAELSRQVGLAQASIIGWKNGSIPRADIAVRLAKILDTSVEYLISGIELTNPENGKTIPSDGNYFLIPILDQELSAGHGDLIPESDEIMGLVPVSTRLRKYGKDLGVLFVHGDSMEPTLHDGEPIVCTTKGWDSGEGLYAIRLNGNGYVKRIQVISGKILIRSDNPLYPPIEEPLSSENFSIIGKVVCSLKFYR